MERLDKHADKKRAAQAEKRFKGRLRKWLGDLCLLCGTALDAVKHYLAAANECRSSGDALWQAAAIEGLCAALCGAVLGPGQLRILLPAYSASRFLMATVLHSAPSTVLQAYLLHAGVSSSQPLLVIALALLFSAAPEGDD